MHNKDGYSRVVGISQYVEELKDGNYRVSCHGKFFKFSFYE